MEQDGNEETPPKAKVTRRIRVRNWRRLLVLITFTVTIAVILFCCAGFDTWLSSLKLVSH
jgi:hypothetical protein